LGQIELKEVQPMECKMGTLYVIATPIGNLEDISLRALRILKEVDAVACEDTRRTLKLLNAYKIQKRLISYYQPIEGRKSPLILALLKGGKDIALVSDSGTPGLSDPGFRLIREAVQEGMTVVPVPGASAVATALSAAGLPTDRFLFLGFPPPKREATRKLLVSLKEERATLVFYLPTRKIAEFLLLLEEALGTRQVVIARELTKIHEEFIRGEARELLSRMGEKKLKGEATVLVQGRR
jgi:16S rRNA (cytidine1402-2'-O)-methyltransferase